MQQVKAVKMNNVYDKEQLYIVIGDNPTTRVIINVGKKTWDAVNKLTQPQNEQKNKKEVVK